MFNFISYPESTYFIFPFMIVVSTYLSLSYFIPTLSAYHARPVKYPNKLLLSLPLHRELPIYISLTSFTTCITPPF